MAILRLEWTPRAKGAVKSAGKSAKYYTFREGDDQAARIWYARDGRTLEYAEARERIRTNARTHGYTYHVMVSTKDSPLQIIDYRQVMRRSSKGVDKPASAIAWLLRWPPPHPRVGVVSQVASGDRSPWIARGDGVPCVARGDCASCVTRGDGSLGVARGDGARVACDVQRSQERPAAYQAGDVHGA